MAQYPIAANVAILGTSIDSLISKMVNNLTTKGIVGVSTSMTLTQLIDKVLEVKYQPITRSSRSARGIVTTLDSSLEALSESLNEAHIRFKLKLEVMGVTGLTESMTFNDYADKILEMKTTPQYELYPRSINIGANGSYAEFYFNTTDALKVDFSVTDGFTLDRITGQGPGNFIIRISGSNNTTFSAKSATVTVKLDNGKYPSETIGVTQAAGVYTVALEQFQWGWDSTSYIATVPAFGGNFANDGKSCASYAMYRCKWNGITTYEAEVNPFFENLSNGFYQTGVYIRNSNNTTTSQRTANITAWGDIGGRGKATLPVTVTQDAGSVAYTYTGVQSDGLTFNANGANKTHPTWTYTDFGATLRTIWNGIETSAVYYYNVNSQHSIEMTNNGGGFSANSQNLFATDRTTVVGAARTCNVRCVYTEAGKGTFYSEYVTVTQDANAVTSLSNARMTDGGGRTSYPAGKTANPEYYYAIWWNRNYTSGSTVVDGEHAYASRISARTTTLGSFAQNETWGYLNVPSKGTVVSGITYGSVSLTVVDSGHSISASLGVQQAANILTTTTEVGATNVGKICSGDYYCDNIRYQNRSTYTSDSYSDSEYLYRTENPQHVEGQCGYVSPENIVYTYKFYNMAPSEISINGSTMGPYQYSSNFTGRGMGTIQLDINGSSGYSINNIQEFEIQNPYRNTFLLIPRSGYVSNGDTFTFDVV